MNIAEILKNAPKGTKLYSPICGEVTLYEIDDKDHSIVIQDEVDFLFSFTADGKYYDFDYPNGECLLFPSKENRDWSTFKVEPQFPTEICDCGATLGITNLTEEHQYKRNELNALRRLLIARDAWWKVDNDWKPDWSVESDAWEYVIIRREDKVIVTEEVVTARTLAFRTEEIRDKFFETFRDLIEQCKELI